MGSVDERIVGKDAVKESEEGKEIESERKRKEKYFILAEINNENTCSNCYEKILYFFL